MEHNYFLTFKGKGGGEGEISFNVGTKEKSTTLLRLRGKNTESILNEIIRILNRAGCITPIQTGNPSIYSIRDDVGPVVGAYLILIRRARKMDYWMDFFNELLMGRYSRLGGAFSTFLEYAIDLSRESIQKSGGRYTLSPAIVSSFSSALKTFVKKLRSYEDENCENRSDFLS